MIEQYYEVSGELLEFVKPLNQEGKITFIAPKFRTAEGKEWRVKIFGTIADRFIEEIEKRKTSGEKQEFTLTCHRQKNKNKEGVEYEDTVATHFKRANENEKSARTKLEAKDQLQENPITESPTIQPSEAIEKLEENPVTESPTIQPIEAIEKLEENPVTELPTIQPSEENSIIESPAFSQTIAEVNPPEEKEDSMPLPAKKGEFNSIQEIPDDLGKFGEALYNVLGCVAHSVMAKKNELSEKKTDTAPTPLVGRVVNITSRDLTTGHEFNEELRIIRGDDNGIVGTNTTTGEIKNYKLSEPRLAPGEMSPENPPHHHRLLLDAKGNPTGSKIVSLEALDIQNGQRFYESAIQYTEKNGFYGLSKEQLKPHLKELLQGGEVYGVWTSIEKGEKVQHEGKLKLHKNESVGKITAEIIERNEKLEKKETVQIQLQGKQIPLHITSDLWAKLESQEQGVKIKFGTPAAERNEKGSIEEIFSDNKNKLIVKDSSDKECCLKEHTGVGVLVIDKELNVLRFVEQGYQMKQEVGEKQFKKYAASQCVDVENKGVVMEQEQKQEEKISEPVADAPRVKMRMKL